MAKEEYQDNEQPDDDFQAAPEDLREDDEISDSEKHLWKATKLTLMKKRKKLKKKTNSTSKNLFFIINISYVKIYKNLLFLS